MMDVTAVLVFMKVSTDVEHILICAVFKGGFFQETDFNLISAERWYLTPPPVKVALTRKCKCSFILTED